MKRVIRRNCFETNSSSMHSIVVTKYDRPYKENELSWDMREKNEIHIWSDSDLSFDRYPFEILASIDDKVRYAIASFCSYKDDEYCENFVKDLESKLREIYPEFTEIELPKEYRPVFKDQEGNEIRWSNVHFDKYLDENEEEPQYYYRDKDDNKQIAVDTGEEKYYYDYGYVDHQSTGLLQGFLKEKGISLIEFITNKKYLVIIDGDEYCCFENLRESGLFDFDKVIEEYPERDEEGGMPFEYYEYMKNKDKKDD